MKYLWILIISILWIIFIIIYDWFRPSFYKGFQSYDYSYYNLIERRRNHIDYIKNFRKFGFCLIFITIFINASYFFLLYFFITLLFTIYYLINIAYTLYYKKKNFSLDLQYWKFPITVSVKNLIYSVFIIQPVFSGCCFAYDIYKKFYEQSQVNRYDFIKMFFKNIFVGFSYFFISLICEISLSIWSALNSEELYRKTFKNKIQFKLILQNLDYLNKVVFVLNQCKIIKQRIICNDLIIFNPKSAKFSRHADEMSRHMSGKTGHLAINTPGKRTQSLILSHRGLDGHYYLGSYGPNSSKGSARAICNNLSTPSSFDDNLEKMSNVVSNTGLMDRELRNQFISEQEFINICNGSTGAIVTQIYRNNKLEVSVTHNNYYDETNKFHKEHNITYNTDMFEQNKLYSNIIHNIENNNNIFLANIISFILINSHFSILLL